MLSLLAVVAAALMGLSSAQQVWLINAWSLQYTRQALNPAAKQSVPTDPPAGHARAALWLASAALQSGNPTPSSVTGPPASSHRIESENSYS